MLKQISGNVIKDSREFSTRVGEMFDKIPGNVQEDSRECSRRFRGMFKEIPWNAFNFKLIKATFYCDLTLLYLMKQ